MEHNTDKLADETKEDDVDIDQFFRKYDTVENPSNVEKLGALNKFLSILIAFNAIGIILSFILIVFIGFATAIILVSLQFIQIIFYTRISVAINIIKEKESNDTEVTRWFKERKKKMSEIISWYDSLEDEYKQ